jgi:hypothetical protein
MNNARMPRKSRKISTAQSKYWSRCWLEKGNPEMKSMTMHYLKMLLETRKMLTGHYKQNIDKPLSLCELLRAFQGCYELKQALVTTCDHLYLPLCVKIASDVMFLLTDRESHKVAK